MLASLLDLIEGDDDFTEQELRALEEFGRGLGGPHPVEVIDDDYIARLVAEQKEGTKETGIGALI